MEYYIGLIILIILIYLITSRSKKNGRRRFFVLSALLVILFQGLRSFSVGIDLRNYIPGYIYIGKYVPLGLTEEYANFESGYVLLNKLIYMLGFDERWFLIIITIITQIPIFYTMYKYSDNPLLSVFVYFSFGEFLVTFSALRQAIAMAICFYAYKFIKEKHPIKFIIAVFFAVCFHKSAIICLILYPLYHIRIQKSAMPLILGMLIAMFLFSDKILGIAVKLYYGKAFVQEDTGAYTMFAMFTLLYIIANHLRIKDTDYEGLLNILMMIAFIYSMAHVHNTITRISFPLSLYLTIFVPKVVDRVKERFSHRHDRLLNVASNVLCIVCLILNLGYLNTLPFSFL